MITICIKCSHSAVSIHKQVNNLSQFTIQFNRLIQLCLYIVFRLYFTQAPTVSSRGDVFTYHTYTAPQLKFPNFEQIKLLETIT